MKKRYIQCTWCPVKFAYHQTKAKHEREIHMKVHYDANAQVRGEYRYDFCHRAPCGAYSKHGLSVTNIPSDVTCEKCLNDER